MEFKKDDVLICVEVGANGYLTNGKEYVTISSEGEFVRVIDDYGDSNSFRLSRFKLKEKEVKEIKWVVGQEVWDVRKGKGVVKCVNYDLEYPVRVELGREDMRTYTIDGKYEYSDLQRSLYFSEPVISAELHPKFIPTLIGKRIVTAGGVFLSVKDEDRDAIYSLCNKRLLKHLHAFYEIGEQVKFD